MTRNHLHWYWTRVCYEGSRNTAADAAVHSSSNELVRPAAVMVEGAAPVYRDRFALYSRFQTVDASL